MLNKKLYSQLDFVKEKQESYFEILRLARLSEGIGEQANNTSFNIALLNQLPIFANEHKRIIPLLSYKAKALNIFNELSQETQHILTTITQQGIVTELAQHKQLSELISVLSAKTIPIILLKGSAFAGTLYNINAPRTSNDLDILIQKTHWHEAIATIKEVMSYAAKEKPDVFGDLYELSFVPNSKTGAALDLHVSLTHPLLFNVCEKQLWESSVQHPKYNNALVRILSPEHALIHQAIHGYKDMNFCKYNLVDSHELLSKCKPDIQETIETAQKWGVSIPLFTLLKNCTQIMHSDFETEKLNQIEPSFVTSKMISTLLKSRSAQPTKNKKSIKFRINQVIAQFVFNDSIIRPLLLQWLFIKLLLFPNKEKKLSPRT